MAKLFLQRHLKSQWNLENRFAGWVDNPLSKEGADSSVEVAKGMAGENVDIIFTSPLMRNMQTTTKILRHIGTKYPLFIHLDNGKMEEWGNFEGGNETCILAYVSEKLNERYYGKLQGLNKDEAKKEFGEEQVQLWRRSYDVAPPEGESLKNTYERAVPFYKEIIETKLKEGKNVLIVSSGNALRAIVKYIDNIPDDRIADFEIPFGGLVKYDFEDGKYHKL